MGGLIKKAIGTPLKLLGLGGKKSAAPDAEPTLMPDANDEAVRKAKKRSAMKQKQRTGRASTILSDTLG